jgi:hypothetical protein
MNNEDSAFREKITRVCLIQNAEEGLKESIFSILSFTYCPGV